MNEIGKYDKIISIEMIEAVGRENLDVYFNKIKTLLKSDGIAVIQGIFISDDQ